MADFDDALRERLARNEQLAVQRAEAEQVMDRLEQERAEEDQRRAREAERARRARHEELVDHVRGIVGEVTAAAPERTVARMGWTSSGEEFIVKVETVQLKPRRSLFIELDRDDDEVLVRWHSDVGNSLEMWRLLEATPQLLSQLLLQLVDDTLWSGADRPPPFPSA